MLRRVDWAAVLASIRAAGFSLRQVQQHTGVSRSAASRYATGCEPGHSDGEQLLDLWSAATGQPRNAVPVVMRSTVKALGRGKSITRHA
ncbi:MAG: hypothetical protein ING59_12550 [Burkholderiales bacterium]|nr:hypothetical protein [Burkholderiales bacterium]